MANKAQSFDIIKEHAEFNKEPVVVYFEEGRMKRVMPLSSVGNSPVDKYAIEDYTLPGGTPKRNKKVDIPLESWQKHVERSIDDILADNQEAYRRITELENMHKPVADSFEHTLLSDRE